MSNYEGNEHSIENVRFNQSKTNDASFSEPERDFSFSDFSKDEKDIKDEEENEHTESRIQFSDNPSIHFYGTKNLIKDSSQNSGTSDLCYLKPYDSTCISNISWSSTVPPSHNDNSEISSCNLSRMNYLDEDNQIEPTKTKFNHTQKKYLKAKFIKLGRWFYVFLPVWISLLLAYNSYILEDYYSSISNLSFHLKNAFKTKIDLNKSSQSTLSTSYINTDGIISYPEILKEHSKEFDKSLVKISSNIYGAIGYGLANCYLIHYNDGIILIDTMETPTIMNEIWTDWLNKFYYPHFPSELVPPLPPIKEIIYTHFHADHTFGTSAIFQPGITEIYSHELTHKLLSKTFNLLGGTTYKRAMRQFGSLIKGDNFLNAGIGIRLHYNNFSEVGSVLPTKTFSGKESKTEWGGIHMIHAPGESKDHTIIVLHEDNKTIVFSADNIYKSFPNIYAIRGTESRDCLEWVKSLDLIHSLQPDILLLGHTKPIYGKNNIQEILKAYSDAIRFIHDQTLRNINLGYTLEETIKRIKLPKNLANHPYLQQTYGTLPWAIRGIFTQYLGWFSGDSIHLNPLDAQEKAERLGELAGGFSSLINAGFKSYDKLDYQWSLELSSAALLLNPRSKQALELKIASLKGLASQQSSAPGRNWYLTSALELSKDLDLSISKWQKNRVIDSLTVEKLLEYITKKINPDYIYGSEKIIQFMFDEGISPCLHLRNSIAITYESCSFADTTIFLSEEVFKGILKKELNPLFSYFSGKIRIKGSFITLALSLLQIDRNVD